MFSREALLRGSTAEQRPVVAVAAAPTDRAIQRHRASDGGRDAQQVRIPFPITQIENSSLVGETRARRPDACRASPRRSCGAATRTDILRRNSRGAGLQPVAKVWRRTETSEAPRRQGATTENRGPRRAWFARWGGNTGSIRARSNAARAGVPNAAAALGWSGDASPVECSQTFTTGC